MNKKAIVLGGLAAIISALIFLGFNVWLLASLYWLGVAIYWADRARGGKR